MTDTDITLDGTTDGAVFIGLPPRPPLPGLPRQPRTDYAAPTPAPPTTSGTSTIPAAKTPTVVLDETPELTDDDYRVVSELCDRVSTRLTAEDRAYTWDQRRELTRSIATEELNAWILDSSATGQPVPAERKEPQLVRAVVAQIDGLGRLTPLLERTDVEDIHIVGNDPVTLRLSTGELVRADAIASTDAQMLRTMQAFGERAGDQHQASRELSTVQPFLPVRIRSDDPHKLGGRLQAVMDVVPRPSAMIRIHRIGNPSLADHYRRRAIDRTILRFLRHAVWARRSIIVTGTTGAGKTSTLRALGATIPWNNVVVTVEDERELGLHLPAYNSTTGEWTERYAVNYAFESRLANAEGRGAVEMADSLHAGLRLSPTWTIVGEVRGGYVMTMLDAVTSGISPVMCTIHAPTPQQIFEKVLLNSLKNEHPPTPELAMRSLSAVDLVVHVERDTNWQRFIGGIYEVGPVGDNGDPSLNPIFAPRHDGRAVPVGSTGLLSAQLLRLLTETGYNPAWLQPGHDDWDLSDQDREHALAEEQAEAAILLEQLGANR